VAWEGNQSKYAIPALTFGSKLERQSERVGLIEFGINVSDSTPLGDIVTALCQYDFCGVALTGVQMRTLSSTLRCAR
jgi:hypothetical protein